MERTLHIVVECGDIACEHCSHLEFYGPPVTTVTTSAVQSRCTDYGPPTATAAGEVVRCGLFRSDSAAGIVSKKLERTDGVVLRCSECLAADARPNKEARCG